MSGLAVRNGVEIPYDAPPGGGGLPPDPDETLDYLPSRSESISFPGTLLDYLPEHVTCKSPEVHMTWNATGDPLLGIIDPDGKQHTSYEYTAYFDQLVGTGMVDPESAIAEGSTLIEVDY
jgi:hypothetical protein